MPFETLATDGENPWAVATDVAFRLSRVDWFPTASLGSLRNEELPGREKSTYQLENAGGERVTLGKTYEAASAAKVEGKPQVALNGDGSLSFDAGRRLFASSKMKIRVSVHDGPVLLEVPVAVSYDLVSEAEEAKLKADLEKSRQDREKFSQDLKRPVTGGQSGRSGHGPAVARPHEGRCGENPVDQPLARCARPETVGGLGGPGRP